MQSSKVPGAKKGAQAAWQSYHSLIPFHRLSCGKVDPQDRAGRWVVLEKVHGANFCFVVNDTEVLGARRTAVLKAQERFYCWQSVLAKYETALRDLHKRVRLLPGFRDTTEVCVFGELFGGAYPHAEVAGKDVSAIQQGVWYSPDIDFFAFDIQAVRASRRRWLDFPTTIELFKTCGLFHAEALMEGTLDECLAFDIRINSTIPARLGLPPIDKNQMEGVVVKAVGTVNCLGLDASGKPVRAIFKKKNEQFDEVNPRPSSEYHPNGSRKSRKERTLEAMEREMDRYVNVNRLHSLESKTGPVTKENAGEAARELAEDALKDFIADHLEQWTRLDVRGQEIRRKHFRSRVSAWLNDHLAASP